MSDIPGLSPIGPGSQPGEDDGNALQYMEMPSGMATFSVPDLPEPADVSGLAPGKAVLERVLALLLAHTGDGTHNIIDLAGLDPENRAFVDQVLGEGEVSVVAAPDTQAQESVLAGVWRIRAADNAGRMIRDVVEVAHFPSLLLQGIFDGAQASLDVPARFADGVFNAPPLLAEINEHIPQVKTGGEPHVLNLSLLPHTVEDLELLDSLLGKGRLIVLSRGYGNCRVESTGTRNCWWVRFYNSQDAIILNTLEITSIPEVIRAAQEDIADSAERLEEILQVYR